MEDAKYFIWGYEIHFRISAQSTAEGLFAALDPALKPQITLLGIKDDVETNVHPICVEPDDGPFRPEHFGNVTCLGEELERVHPSKNTLCSDPSHQESVMRGVRFESLREAVNRAASTALEWSDQVTFSSLPVKVGKHLVFILLCFSRSAYEKHARLRRQYVHWVRTPLRLERSLIDAATAVFFEDIRHQLRIPGASGFGRQTNTDELLRRSGSLFMDTPACCTQNLLGIHGNYGLCNELSSLRYEGEEGVGSVLYGRRDHPDIAVDLSLLDPVRLRDVGAVRKLLQLADTRYSLLTDAQYIFGLGRTRKNYNPNTESLFEIRFISQFVWELRHHSVPLMRVKHGIPSLPSSPLDRALLVSEIGRIFRDSACINAERIADVVEVIADQKHGAILVVASDAASEVERLAKQSTRIEALALTTDRIASVTSIDGAVLIDPEATCHAVGVILDGMASNRCRSDRGSRFNSAVRYVFGQGSAHRLAIVKSEDGMVDILPALRPRISKRKVAEALAGMREAASSEPVDRRNLSKALDRLREIEFYLSDVQCEEITRLYHEAEERLPLDAIRISLRPFARDPDMDDSYFVDED